MSRFDIFSIRDEDKNPIVVGLLGVLKERDVEIQKLKEEIARLKKYPSKPGNLSKRDRSISKKKQTGMPISREATILHPGIKWQAHYIFSLIS